MKGSFSITVNRDNREIYNVDFDNLILSSGIDILLDNMASTADTSLVDTLLFGNGTTEPDFSDAGLSGSRVGVVKLTNTEWYGGYYSNNGDESDYRPGGDIVLTHNVLIFDSIATTYATITEIATAMEVGENDYKLFSKTLIKNNGTNIALSIAPGDTIKVRYQVVNKHVEQSNESTVSMVPTRLSGKAFLFNGYRYGFNRWSIMGLSQDESKIGCEWSYTVANRDYVDKKFIINYKLKWSIGSPGHLALINHVDNQWNAKGYFIFYLGKFVYRVMLGSIQAGILPHKTKDIELDLNISVSFDSGMVDVFKHFGYLNTRDEYTGTRNPVDTGYYVRPFTYINKSDVTYYSDNRSFINGLYKLRYTDIYGDYTTPADRADTALIPLIANSPVVTKYTEEHRSRYSSTISGLLPAGTAITESVYRNRLFRIRCARVYDKVVSQGVEKVVSRGVEFNIYYGNNQSLASHYWFYKGEDRLYNKHTAVNMPDDQKIAIFGEDWLDRVYNLLDDYCYFHIVGREIVRLNAGDIITAKLVVDNYTSQDYLLNKEITFKIPEDADITDLLNNYSNNDVTAYSKTVKLPARVSELVFNCTVGFDHYQE